MTYDKNFCNYFYGSYCFSFLKKYGREFSLLTVICAALRVFALITGDLYTLIGKISDLTESVSGVSSYLKLMLKVLALSLISQLLSNICRDCGESVLASQTEIAAKILMLIITLPLFESVIEIVTGLLK
ncbi:MAG: stage III sporulation AC/AD family protein [Clostridiales bacterium]|nr:stage III sporulation AC/AD family protein [Clostridiales bacterium]